MKKLYILALSILAVATGAFAQTNFNIGGGYFGQTVTHPGIVLEAELEQTFSDRDIIFHHITS